VVELKALIPMCACADGAPTLELCTLLYTLPLGILLFLAPIKIGGRAGPFDPSTLIPPRMLCTPDECAAPLP